MTRSVPVLLSLIAVALTAVVANAQPVPPPQRPAYTGRVENIQNTEPFYVRLKNRLVRPSDNRPDHWFMPPPSAGEMPQNNRAPVIHGHGGREN